MRKVLERSFCLCAVILLSLGVPVRAAGPQDTAATAQSYPFQNPDLPTEKRIDNIISLLTLDEKIGCLSTNPSVPRLGIRVSRIVEGIHGLAMSGPANWAHKPPIPTTSFQQGIGLGETWDPELVRSVASAEGVEARYIFQSPKYGAGGLVVLSPNADLGRDPRWGRTEECYGEDAFLNGTMVRSFVRGLQGDDPKYWLTASLLKHFLANSNEVGRERTSSDFDERLFREYYSVPFREGIVAAGSRAFMASYNRVNGIPMAVSPILESVTRKEWGEDGIITTDGGALKLLVTAHHYYDDLEHAAAACVKSGITMFLDDFRGAVKGAVEKGLITEADVEKAIRPNFRVMIRLGLLDPKDRVKYSAIGSGEEPWVSEAHKSLARLAAQKGIVLLKNEGERLPLDASKVKSIAVVGPRANEVLLDWYSGTPPYRVTPLEGIKERAGSSVEVRYAADNANGAAAEAAKGSDVAVVVVGNHPTCDGAGWGHCDTPSDGREAVDRRSLTLEQEELIKQVYEANHNTIVVLVSSFPYAINWTQANVPAILHIAHSSQEEGHAIADVLFGDYDPAGRLVQTWPTSMDQLPPMMDYDIRHGRTYMYFKGDPLYPFGFGKSYTTFAYSNLRTSSDKLRANGTIDVDVDVTNTGKRAGEEVVQLYVHHVDSKVARPERELRAFARVPIAAGEKKTVRLTLPATSLAYWNEQLHRFVVEGDRVELLVGASSADIRARKIVSVAGR